MGIGSMLRGGLRAAAKVAKPLGKIANNPIVSGAASFIPGGGLVAKGIGMAATAATVYGAAKSLRGAVGPAQPMMPGGFSGGNLPALPGVAANRMGAAPMVMPGNTGSFGLPRGPGGRLQLPWNDPSVPAFLKQFALDDSFIKPAMRAPRGYVIVRDPDGQAYPVLKTIAQKFKLWRPAKKPPISVRDWQALKRSDRTIKKLRKIVTMTARVDKHVSKGGKVKFHKKGA